MNPTAPRIGFDFDPGVMFGETVESIKAQRLKHQQWEVQAKARAKEYRRLADELDPPVK